MLVEGEVNLILPLRHRPVCSDSKMSNQAFQNPHLFGWEQGIRAVCISKEMLRKAFFCGSTHALDSVYSPDSVSLTHPHPVSISPNSNIFNHDQPKWLTVVKSSTLSRLDMVLTCTDNVQTIFCHYLNTLLMPPALLSSILQGRGVKRQKAP